MAAAEAPEKVSRNEWVVLTDEDDGRLWYKITNVLKGGKKIVCKAGPPAPYPHPWRTS